MINSNEQSKLTSQVNASGRSQSDYLRYLLLDAPHRRTVEPKNSYSLSDTIKGLGRRLNFVAKNVNKALLKDETITIATNETVFIDLCQTLEHLATRVVQIKAQKQLVRDIQVKFLVTPTQLAAAKAKMKVKDICFSRYMRQQVTGYKEVKYKNKAEDIIRAVSRLGNNVNQIVSAIAVEEKAHRLVIIAPETKFEILTLQQNIARIQRSFIGTPS